MAIDEEHAEIYADLWAGLDAMPVAVFVQDADRKVRWINMPCAALLQMEPEDAVGRTCADVLGCTCCTPHCSACQAREQQQSHAGFAVDLVLPDHRRHSMIMDAVPLRDGLVAVLLTDVTDADGLMRAFDERRACRELVRSWLTRPV